MINGKKLIIKPELYYIYYVWEKYHSLNEKSYVEKIKKKRVYICGVVCATETVSQSESEVSFEATCAERFFEEMSSSFSESGGRQLCLAERERGGGREREREGGREGERERGRGRDNNILTLSRNTVWYKVCIRKYLGAAK